MPDGEGVVVDVEGGTATVRIDRPAARNAVDVRAAEALVEAFGALDEDPSVRVVVVTGTGDRAFCAGQDLKERARAASGGAGAGRDRRAPRRVAEALWEVRKPTVAAVNGDAVGLGVELALACDLRVIASHARFALPESRLGIGARFAAASLSRQVPPAIYYRWCYLGDFVPAQELERWGVVNEVVDGDVLARSLDVARALCERAPLSLAHFKAMMVRGRDLPVAAAVRAGFHPDPFTSEDAREGVAAFVEKRSPVWRGR